MARMAGTVKDDNNRGIEPDHPEEEIECFS